MYSLLRNKAQQLCFADDQMKQVTLKTFKNKSRLVKYVERDVFTCIELNIPNKGNWMKRVCAYAETVMGDLNRGQANTSKQRSASTVEIDNLSGLIAEHACDTILRWQFGDENIIKPRSDNSFNQIDIELITGKTIEVRSSCVRNGIEFALFAKDTADSRQQYFDVIGPYSNSYKPGEQLKDYYMRVLYACDKKNFMELFERPVLQLFITGGATKAMMQDTDVYQNKHLVPAGGQVRVESDYRVVPLGKSLDAPEFLHVLARENGFVSLHDLSRL